MRSDYRKNLPDNYRKPNVAFTKERKEMFLRKFAETGLVMLSSAYAGVADQTIRRHVKADEEFADAYDAVRKIFCETIEMEIKKRAMDGYEEPVYQKGRRVYEYVLDEEGNKIVDPKTGEPRLKAAVIMRTSDRMLELFARRMMPEYRDKATLDVNVSGGVLAIPAPGGEGTKALEDKEWETQFADALVVNPIVEEITQGEDAPLRSGENDLQSAPPAVQHREKLVPKGPEPKNTRRIKR